MSRPSRDGCGSWLPYEPKCFSVASPIPKERSETFRTEIRAIFACCAPESAIGRDRTNRRCASIYATIIIKRPPQQQTAGQRLHTDGTYPSVALLGKGLYVQTRNCTDRATICQVAAGRIERTSLVFQRRTAGGLRLAPKSQLWPGKLLTRPPKSLLQLPE